MAASEERVLWWQLSSFLSWLLNHQTINLQVEPPWLLVAQADSTLATMRSFCVLCGSPLQLTRPHDHVISVRVVLCGLTAQDEASLAALANTSQGTSSHLDSSPGQHTPAL